MVTQQRRSIYRFSTGVQIAGLTLFLVWLSQTDFMFGHFSGPPDLLILILLCAIVGLTGYGFLGVTALLQSKEPTDQTRRSCLSSAGTAILTIASILIILTAIPELQRARRYKRLYGAVEGKGNHELRIANATACDCMANAVGASRWLARW